MTTENSPARDAPNIRPEKQAEPQARSILALVPAYNEGGKVAEVVRISRQYLPVLVVDDGSIDNTASQAEQAGAHLVSHEKNQGKGAALKTGYRWALEHNYSAVVMLDADMQHDPHEIPLFLEAFAQGHADLIIGSRNYHQMPIVRRITNHIGRWSFSWAMGQYIPDNQSGYRLLSARLMQALLESREEGFHFEVEMFVTCLKNGMKLDWVPIKTIYGDEGSHINPIEHVPNFFRVVFKARREMSVHRQQSGRG